MPSVFAHSRICWSVSLSYPLAVLPWPTGRLVPTLTALFGPTRRPAFTKSPRTVRSRAALPVVRSISKLCPSRAKYRVSAASLTPSRSSIRTIRVAIVVHTFPCIPIWAREWTRRAHASGRAPPKQFTESHP